MRTMIQFLAEDCPEVHSRYSLGYRMRFSLDFYHAGYVPLEILPMHIMPMPTDPCILANGREKVQLENSTSLFGTLFAN